MTIQSICAHQGAVPDSAARPVKTYAVKVARRSGLHHWTDAFTVSVTATDKAAAKLAALPAIYRHLGIDHIHLSGWFILRADEVRNA